MDKPEALRLADELDDIHTTHVARNAAAELRRLSAENKLLHERHHDDNVEYTRVLAQRDVLLEQRDELRRALEIIAVGDATNPQAQAAEELIALGYWRDIPEARAAIKTVEEGK